MSYFLGIRTNTTLLSVTNEEGEALFLPRRTVHTNYLLAPANPRTNGGDGLWILSGGYTSLLKVGGHSYQFSDSDCISTGTATLTSAMYWIIRSQLSGVNIFPNSPENVEDHRLMREELLLRASEDPYGLLTLVYLQRYRKELKITLGKLQSHTGKRYTTIMSNGQRHIVPGNWRSIGWNAMWTPSDVFERMATVNWAPLLRARPEEAGAAPVEVLRYSTRVQDILSFKLEPNKPYIGIEIELESLGDVRTSLQVAHKHIGKHAIFKGDGSISHGFEIVTKPDLWKNHRSVMEPFFKEIGQHMEARSNCGIHIHLSRSGLSFLQLAKMLEFVNSSNNREFIFHIAGRRDNHYCLPKNEINITSAGRNLNNGNNRFGDRYQAINLQNEATIEFRIFASTTKFDSFLKYMQFVIALREYTAPGATSLSPKVQINYTEFVKWLGSPENRKEFPQLLAAATAFQPQ